MTFPYYEVDKNGLNKKIKCHVLSDKEMKDLNFSLDNDYWVFSKLLDYSDLDKEHLVEISFNLKIKKDETEWFIDILDENYFQPYDYQRYLKCDLNTFINEYALSTFFQVEELMEFFSKKNILTGHIRGEYI